jgi:hypothetical protein
LVYSSTLKSKALCCSETSFYFQRTTTCKHRCENPQPKINWGCLRAECWGGCLDLTERKQQEARENSSDELHNTGHGNPDNNLESLCMCSSADIIRTIK